MPSIQLGDMSDKKKAPLKTFKNQVSFHEEEKETKDKIKRMPKGIQKQSTSDSKKLKVKKEFS